MKSKQKQLFISSLEQLYGVYKYESALFGTYNYTTISSDLCYSKSHFTKLISGGATEAMYERAINNVEKLIELKELKKRSSNELLHSSDNNFKSSKIWKYLALFFFLVTSFLGVSYFMKANVSNSKVINNNNHPLEMYFDFNDSHYYKSPYLTEEQVHEFCPCSGYEGRWELSKEYIIPIPYKIPGLYYVGKKADIRFKCRKSNSKNKGQELIGFENIENEIWFDKSMTAIDLNINEGSNFSDILGEINFEENDDFIKIASVFSCFYDEITITPDSIYRLGEPCGRYANGIDEAVLKKYNLNLNHIIEYIIGKMTFAQCSAIPNEFSDPNKLENRKSILSFPCKCYSQTENLGLGGAYPYTKTIRLVEQNYQSNLFCDDYVNGEQEN